jgi:hypothetical protein
MMFRPIASLAFVCLVAFVVYAKAGGGGVPLPERNPLRPHGATAKAPVLPGDRPTIPWTDQEIADAKAACAKALPGLAIEYEPLQPMKHGICGAPAPILVRSIGSDPKVEIDPPATITCPLAAALSKWLSRTVQPEAEVVLSTQLIKLRNATSYSCRNRYGGANTPLSEHALANALDVSEFVFASGEHITVLESWPRLVATPPAPPPNPSRIPVASAPIKPVSQIRAAGERPGQVAKIRLAEAKINPFVAPTPVMIDAKTNPFVLPTAAVEETPSSPAPETMSPKPAAPETQSAHDARSEFVRIVHDDACHTFGTVLGPEANEAHKNHFHLDMKARRHPAVCE